uniref:Uncharacterized protein n=1 Tax=Lactuca sativa TaxID=4236 RepID=A0A9R1WQ99_LACSA|nr:hypothetical protein LSAT_V11C900467820 [Lactuca sativa]
MLHGSAEHLWACLFLNKHLADEVQLMLVLALTACILSEIALSEAFDVFARSNKFYVFSLFENTQNEVNLPRKPKKEVVAEETSKKKTEKWPLVLHVDTSIFALFLFVLMGAFYVKHIQLFKLCSLLIHLKVFMFLMVSERLTHAMASKTVIVDNTTWNNTHCYCWYYHVITRKSCLRIFQLFGCLVLFFIFK